MIDEQWSAASALLQGIAQRIGTAEEREVYPALDVVSSSVLVQVELMMVFDAIQDLYKLGRPLNYDTIMAAVQAQEPGGGFGFACGVFETIWQGRTTADVDSTEFSDAVDLLVRIRTERDREAKNN
jgi:hypothetical protein